MKHALISKSFTVINKALYMAYDTIVFIAFFIVMLPRLAMILWDIRKVKAAQCDYKYL